MGSEPWILGISLSHNGAVCLLKGEEIVVAIQEERLSRIKRDFIYGAKPARALSYCLDYAGIKLLDLSLIVVSASAAIDLPEHDLRINSILSPVIDKVPIVKLPHHLGHAVGVFSTSGFSSAAVLIIDGAGSPYQDLFEWEKSNCKVKKLVDPLEKFSETASLYFVTSESITCLEKHLGSWIKTDKPGMPRFSSLGGMYAAVSGQIFGDVSEAGKVMGLAPYGVSDVPTGDFFSLSEDEFIFHDYLPNRYLHNEHWPLRSTEYKNLAASVQKALEDAVSYLVDNLYKQCRVGNLCYAGGVALNSVMNERIIRESEFKNVYIMPAAEDSGVAIGAAYYGLWRMVRKNVSRKLISDAVGKKYFDSDILAAEEKLPAVTQVTSQSLIDDVVDLLCEGKMIGWFQGRSELGPRALGQRSIICDPRLPNGKQILNDKVKHREDFRPFAPVVLLEEVENWFEMGNASPESPFMLRVCPFRNDKLDKVPAVVHVDGTGRVQTVTKSANGLFYELVRRFYEKTGVPILLNTSFNIMGEPIVETPEDALLCFQTAGIDFCVIEDRLFSKSSAIMFDESHVAVYERLREKTRDSLNFFLANTKGSDYVGVPCAYEQIDDYVGNYENPTHGLFKVFRNGVGMKGQSKDLGVFDINPLKDNVYGIKSNRYRGLMLMFLRNARGIVDCIAVLSRNNINLHFYFYRIGEDNRSGTNMLTHLTGTYKRDSKILEVILNDGKLFAGIVSQRRYELVYCKGLIFCLKGMPGYGIEFVVNEYEKIESAIIVSPEKSIRLHHTAESL